MPVRTRLATPLALLALLAILSAPSAASPSNQPPPPPPPPQTQAQPDGPRALDGEWIYVEDRTEGRALEDQQPGMSTRFRLRVEKDAVVLVRTDGEIRMPLDGSPTEVAREGFSSRYRGEWKDGAFEYQSEPVRKPDDTRTGGLIKWVLRPTADAGDGKGGLLASVAVDSRKSVALYRHPQDIALPTPAKAPGGIADMAWLAGAWVGKRGTGNATSIEERWSPPRGGAMLAVSRTVSRDRMRAFEFLRIVERDGGLVYIAQPNGRTATEFVLTELTATRAVFENPRHDSPQRIVYELAAEGSEGEKADRLTASIGFTKGGRPQRFEYQREGANPSPPPPPPP